MNCTIVINDKFIWASGGAIALIVLAVKIKPEDVKEVLIHAAKYVSELGSAETCAVYA